MTRIKVSQYKIYEKGREYSVLKFPCIKHMWVYDDRPEEDCYMVDGPPEVFSMLKYAFAILIEASDKIIYFPCKQDGIGSYYTENYDLVLCGPKAQFRRSLWVKLKRKLQDSNLTEKYVLQYSRKKLDDFCLSRLLEKDDRYNSVRYFIKTEMAKKMKKEYFEEVVGETVFMVVGKEECYYYHYRICKDLDEYEAGYRYGTWTAVGYILPDKAIQSMYEK